MLVTREFLSNNIILYGETDYFIRGDFRKPVSFELNQFLEIMDSYP